jgi:hypothetical protein
VSVADRFFNEEIPGQSQIPLLDFLLAFISGVFKPEVSLDPK